MQITIPSRSLKLHQCNNVSQGIDWIVQCFTSPPTQYRLYGRWFL